MISTRVSRTMTWLMYDKRRLAAALAVVMALLGVSYYNGHKATGRSEVCSALTDLESRLSDPSTGFFDNATFRASSRLGDLASRAAADDGTDMTAVHAAGARLSVLGDRTSVMADEFETAAAPVRNWCVVDD
jgi:hypothetical protein